MGLAFIVFGGKIVGIMPSIAALVTDKIIASYGNGQRLTISDAVRSVGGSESYARNGKLTKTKEYLSRLPELNAAATARKIKLEALADKYAKKKIKDAKFSELAAASSIYRKDIQVLTGGNSGNEQVVNVNFIKFSDTVGEPSRSAIPNEPPRDT